MRAVLAAVALLPLAARAQDAVAPPAAPAAPAPAWVARSTADLTALDKVSAKTMPLAIAVGGHAAFGTLTIAVRACEVRPPELASDATAFVDVTDANPGAPQFHGWLVRSAPAVSALQHPLYDLRLAGCR